MNRTSVRHYIQNTNKTYRNKNFTKRDYESTNIVACVAAEAPKTPDNRWERADASILRDLTSLYVENGVRFYGLTER